MKPNPYGLKIIENRIWFGRYIQLLNISRVPLMLAAPAPPPPRDVEFF
jgi:hypothetical protein